MAIPTETALADLLGGFDGGWAFWRASLAAIELAVERSRERDQSFCSHPPGEWRRLMFDLQEALQLAALAVDVQLLVNGDVDGDGGERRGSIDRLLQERLREVKSRNGT